MIAKPLKTYEAASRLGVSERHLRKLADSGVIPGAFKVPGGQQWHFGEEGIRKIERGLWLELAEKAQC